MPGNTGTKVPLYPAKGIDHARSQDQSTLTPSSDRVVLKPGAQVIVRERLYRISQILDLEPFWLMTLNLGKRDDLKWARSQLSGRRVKREEGHS